MGMVVFAAVCSILALLTGIAAIGSGRHWQFDNIDILRGKRNAILYIWVTISSIFSLAHTTANVGYAIDPVWGFSQEIQFWFFIHAIVGLLLSAAHAYVFMSLELHPGRGDEFLWVSAVFDSIDLRSPLVQHHVWIATAGAMLVLIQSVLSGTRRVWWRLLLSCLVGGASATLAGYIFADSKWVYAICGVAAIVGENVIFGLFKASEQFKDSPIEVFSKLWRLVMPTFGKSVGDPAADVQKEAPAG